MKAIIMAGGEGTRLRPLTVSRPKPMVPVCNRPVMEYTLELLKRYAITTAIATLHYKAEDISAYFGDGSEFGVHMMYSVEKAPMGTAGSVKEIEQSVCDDTFIVISGDGLTDIDLGKAIAFHKEKHSVATLILKRVNNPLEYGVVITDKDGRIERFLEKPSWGEVFSDQVNTGIYILEPEIFGMMERGKVYDFSKDIFPRLLADKKALYGYVADGYWCDIGDIEHYAAAQRDMFNGKVLQEMVGERRGPGIWIGEGTQIDPSAVLEAPLCIGRGCRIGANAYLSSYNCIGDNCIIEDNVRLVRNIVFNNVFIGRKTNSVGSIIGRKCTINAGVSLNDGVVIGENVFIGSGAAVLPQISIWPDKHIADGAIVSENLVWGCKAAETLFGRNGITGLGNLEITPEVAMKLGAAFGTMLPKGSTVAVSRDAHPGCRLLTRSVISGLCSVGVNVYDLRMLPVPVSRYIVSRSDAVGGIHIRIYRDESREIEIEFFDANGINIEKTRERKLENLFVRQDFRRTDIDEVGLISYLDDSASRYMDSVIERFDIEDIKAAKFKIVVDYSYGSACQVLPFILNRLGVETVSLNAYVDYHKAREAAANQEEALKQLADIIKPVGADLGVLVDAEAEKFSLVDETGNTILDTNLLALMAQMVFQFNRDSLVAVPISVPSVLEKVASQQKGRIVRTKTDPRSIMHNAAISGGRIAFAGNASGKFIFPSFSCGFDAMFALAQMLKMLALQKRTLSEIFKSVPPHHSMFGRIECNWSEKAKVMRLLVESFRDENLELLDGVQIRFADNSSMLFVPHPSMAHINVWTDSSSKERAEALMERARLIVKKFIEADESELLKLVNNNKESLAAGGSDVLPEDRAFHFWITGRSLGIKAVSLHSFIDILHYIDADSLEYHTERGDFSKWINTELHRPLIAFDLEQVGKAGYKGEDLRLHILECFGENGENDIKYEDCSLDEKDLGTLLSDLHRSGEGECLPELENIKFADMAKNTILAEDGGNLS